MFETINEALKTDFYQDSEIKKMLPDIIKELRSDNISSYVAAQKMMDIYYNPKSKNQL
jgi:LAO/AO transport system kinase